jgi:glyoxalase family protein
VTPEDQSTSVPDQPEARRLQITGLHHITVICSRLDQTVAFYRDLLGMRVVKQTRNQDDPNARHFFFGDATGSPGTVVSCFEYPQMEPGKVGIGSTHHFALGVGSLEELEEWRRYLTSRGVSCTEVLDRTYFHSLYVRDPDGHIVEIATTGPGFTADESPEELGSRMIEPG